MPQEMKLEKENMYETSFLFFFCYTKKELKENKGDIANTFILGVIYKLQDYDYNLETQHKLQIEGKCWTAVIQNLDRKMKEYAYTEGKIEFALIFGQIEGNEKNILKNKLCGIRCIFSESSNDDAVDAVAERVIDISQDVKDESSIDEVHHPMRIAKIRLLDDDTLTDHELLFKVNNPSFFLSLNETRDHQNQFQNFSDEELLLLKLIAKSCKVNATHYRECLVNLFDQFFASKFLRETVTQDINAILLLILAENKQNVQQKAHFYRRFLTFCVEIFVELLRTLPRKMLDSASTFVSMFNLLSGTTNSAFLESCGLWDEKLDKLKAAFITLFNETKTKVSNYTDEEVKARTLSAGVRKEKPPPNNFRELGVFPSPEEILFENRPYLRKNLVDQGYNSVEHYLDVQFRLLREDYIAPLREGIAAYLRCGQNSKRKLNITVYDDVTVFPPTMDKRSGQMVSTVSFASKGMRKVRWEVSRKLLYGSLVCISGDKFRESLYFATIYDRKPQQLAEGKIGVVFELQAGQPIFNYRKTGYVMVESSAYFEAYRHVLQALLTIKDENDMPFSAYFVSCNNKISPPKFLLRNGGQLNLDCLVQNDLYRKNKSIDILNASAWMSHTAFGLDESQYEAIKLALTKELAIIQGPPGTGKTFIGYSITKALLENENVFRTSDTPILVVCYTNHALDQFLEGITTFMKQGLIRIGGRSKNPNMEQYLLKNVNDLNRLNVSSDIRFQLNILRCQKESFENAFVSLSNATSLLSKSIMNYDNLESVADKQLLQQIVRNNEKVNIILIL
uniref:DNA2/NAM7 helicase helicase domain-containing protein n=1 Tax=Romanomermis culicivorax TaxID=13658 RepID=A0A915JJM3_ROMCU